MAFAARDLIARQRRGEFTPEEQAVLDSLPTNEDLMAAAWAIMEREREARDRDDRRWIQDRAWRRALALAQQARPIVVCRPQLRGHAPRVVRRTRRATARAPGREDPDPALAGAAA